MNARNVRWISVALVLIFGTYVQAGPVDFSKPFGKYGTLWNTYDGTSTGAPEPWCAPTSTANSFKYLENQYPGTYDNFLTGRVGLLATRDALCTGWQKPGSPARMGMGVGGASYRSLWESKYYWIADWATGTTIFGGMVDEDPSGWAGGENLTFGKPSMSFLEERVRRCDDIELWFKPASGMSHVVVLTSLHYTDTNGNNRWDIETEEGQIDYQNPNDPNVPQYGTVTLVDGYLKTTCDSQSVTITAAYSEVPEPAALALLTFGGVMLRRRRGS